MSIKQSIAALVILLSVSFSANARFMIVTSSKHSCVEKGQIIEFPSKSGGWPFAPGVCARLKTSSGDSTTG
ncbi:hypothetical protein P3681_26290, partial [Vibrio parahaemolyticus]|nr:hypothetical protein [Vibrio parahaemolyticus]